MEILTQEKLKEILSYDASTGLFTWKERLNLGGEKKFYSGKIAGWVNSKGYIGIRIDGKHFKAHRLAWLYVYGYFPEHQVDHINQIRDDNRLINLREASQSCNMQNQRISSNNKSGITGVSWCNRSGKWRSRITKNNKLIYLGEFSTLLKAAKARYEGELKYFNCVIKSSAKAYVESCHR